MACRIVTTFLVTFVFLLIVLVAVETTNNSYDVNLLVLLPTSGAWTVGSRIAGAATVAIHDINSNQTKFSSDRHWRFSWADTGCHPGKGLGSAIRAIQGEIPVHAIIGAGCNTVCETIGYLATEINLPMISWGCESSTLSYQEDFPTFVRTLGSHKTMDKVFAALIRRTGWTRVGILAASTHSWQLAAEKLRQDLEESGINVAAFDSVEPGRVDNNEGIKELQGTALKKVIKDARVVILLVSSGDVRHLMLRAQAGGLLDGRYVFLTAEIAREAFYGSSSWMGDDGRDEDARLAFQGLLNVRFFEPNTVAYDDFKYRVRQHTGLPPFNIHIAEELEVDAHAGTLYDAIMLYAHGRKMALENGVDEFDGRGIVSFMKNTSIIGVSGIVSIDHVGDRDPDYHVQFFEGQHFWNFAEFSHHTNTYIEYEDISVLYPGEKREPPSDAPPCGWAGEFCEDNTTTLGIVVPLTLAILLGAAAGFTLIYRKWKLEQQLLNETSWRVPYDDLIFNDKLASKGGSSQLRFQSSVSVNTSSGAVSIRQMFTTIAGFRGKQVAVKYLEKSKLVVDRKFLLQLREIMALKHENVNDVIGMCVDSPNECAIMNYCERGSLQDVLNNESFDLTADFKLSFAVDICQGMEYLHQSSLKSHGRLKSSNCLVDKRWTCRISDYGFHSLSNTSAVVGKDNKKCNSAPTTPYSGLLWTAPELLRMPLPPPSGTQKADVYSYAIIMQEVFLREAPFGNCDRNGPAEIIQMVRQSRCPPFRPDVSSESIPEVIKSIMYDGWQEDPALRPTFYDIRKILRKLTKGKSLLDNLLDMMEKHADHLEDLVEERTSQLEEEKRKTDNILNQMLPKSVVESLKTGADVTPEAFPSATIYFSDIVGFTELASQSTPIQVVNLLNDLYSTFDDVIDNYEVYKVETIGDAYMVASGVPEWNMDKHAGHVATMALHILHSVSKFSIAHKPEMQLKLRIGIHTGPVVAGVVGLKMPRYCLFGDTVNTASRMESTGSALKIHISETTKDYLYLLGGYNVEKRGQVEIKGKGHMTTHWLLGKDGFDLKLPNLIESNPLL